MSCLQAPLGSCAGISQPDPIDMEGNDTYSFCIALTTALEKGAEFVFALIVAAKERLSVGKNMQPVPNCESI